MRKTLLLLFLALPGAVAAQYSQYYYHCQGDTLEHDSPTYFHHWWEWEDYYTTLRAGWLGGGTGLRMGKRLQRHDTPDTLKIVGLAGLRPFIHESQYQYCDTLTPDSLYLYGANPFVRLAAVRRHWWRDEHRTIHLRFNGIREDAIVSEDWIPAEDRLTFCCVNHRWDAYFGVYEYYFDSAITVVDSFYVGSDQCWAGLYRVHDWSGMLTGVDCVDRPCDFLSWIAIPGKIIPVGTSTWRHVIYHDVYLIWPIIQVDTTVPPAHVCLPLENLRATAVDTFSATVAWDDFSTTTSRVEVRYGPTATPGINWYTQVVAAGVNSAALSLPRRDQVNYSVIVRPVCDTLKTAAAWSDTLFLTLPRDTATQGIAAAAARVSLHPNPASGEVRVESDHGLRQVELCNAAGTLVYSSPAAGHRHTVPLDGLAAGTYLVMVRTENGLSVSRLSVR